MRGGRTKNIQRTIAVPFTVEQVYTVVSKVEIYPQFVPHCISTTQLHGFPPSEEDLEIRKSNLIYPKGSDVQYHSMQVGFWKISEIFNSRVILIPNQSVKAYAADMAVFRKMDTTWNFVKDPVSNDCIINFNIEFEFRSPWYSYVINLFFDSVMEEMVAAFVGRCRKLYGDRLPSHITRSSQIAEDEVATTLIH